MWCVTPLEVDSKRTDPGRGKHSVLNHGYILDEATSSNLVEHSDFFSLSHARDLMNISSFSVLATIRGEEKP